MYTIKEVLSLLSDFAPMAYQESYDNAGLITGNTNTQVTGVLITLDCVEEVVQEAINKRCNLIIAHHPIVFKGLKKLNGKNYVERTVIKALKNDIAIYAIHTNLDNVASGVNKRICDQLGLVNTKILAPKHNLLTKLTTYVPKDNVSQVLSALHEAGAGQVGAYDHCSFKSTGIGTFRPGDETNPDLGEKGKIEHVNEERVEVILPNHVESKVLSALFLSHPYEEVAYYLTKLENANQAVGSGMIGELDNYLSFEDFFSLLTTNMNLKNFRYTPITKNEVRKVAVCGGAGSFLLNHAIRNQADVFISADFKYHEYFDAENKIVIADIGHYESEVFTKDLIYDILREKLTNIALILSELDTNPIKYYKV